LKPKKVEEITNGVVTARQLYHWQELQETDPNNQRPNHGGARNFLFEPEFQQKVEDTLGEMVSGDEGRTISWYAMMVDRILREEIENLQAPYCFRTIKPDYVRSIFYRWKLSNKFAIAVDKHIRSEKTIWASIDPSEYVPWLSFSCRNDDSSPLFIRSQGLEIH